MKTLRRASNEEIIQALRETCGLVTHAAKKLNTTSATIYNRMNKFPEIKLAYKEIQDEWIDLAESGVKHYLEKKDPEMIRFFLQTKGKKRGYTKSIEHSFGTPESLQLHLDIKSKKIPDMDGNISDEDNNEEVFIDSRSCNVCYDKFSD